MIKTTLQLKSWKGRFGRKYTHRNMISLDGLEQLYKRNYGITRTALNKLFLNKFDRSIHILEVGCNIGNQLLCLKKMGFKNLYGIEPQNYAFRLCKKRTRNITISKADVFNLPFEVGYFDLVFTSGILIHINPKDIKKAMKEIYRCTKSYIWGFEYYTKRYENVPYRGREGLLWRTDFAKLYLELFNNLKLVKEKKMKYKNNGNMDTMFLLKKVKK